MRNSEENFEKTFTFIFGRFSRKTREIVEIKMPHPGGEWDLINHREVTGFRMLDSIVRVNDYCDEGGHGVRMSILAIRLGLDYSVKRFAVIADRSLAWLHDMGSKLTEDGVVVLDIFEWARPVQKVEFTFDFEDPDGVSSRAPHGCWPISGVPSGPLKRPK